MANQKKQTSEKKQVFFTINKKAEKTTKGLTIKNENFIFTVNYDSKILPKLKGKITREIIHSCLSYECVLLNKEHKKLSEIFNLLKKGNKLEFTKQGENFTNNNFEITLMECTKFVIWNLCSKELFPKIEEKTETKGKAEKKTTNKKTESKVKQTELINTETK